MNELVLRNIHDCAYKYMVAYKRWEVVKEDQANNEYKLRHDALLGSIADLKNLIEELKEQNNSKTN